MTEIAPQIEKAPNNTPNMAQRYKDAYNTLFARLPSGLQKRVMELKSDCIAGRPNRDPQANAFIKDVIELAESGAAI